MSAVTGGSHESDARMVEEGIESQLAGVFATAPAHGDLGGAVHAGDVDRCQQIVKAVAVGFHQYHFGCRCKAMGLLNVQRDFKSPTGVARRIPHFDFGEAAVVSGADRQVELSVVNLEVGFGVGIIEGIHNADNLPLTLIGGGIQRVGCLNL